MRRWELVLGGQVRQYSGRRYFRVPGAAQRGGTNGIPAKQKEKRHLIHRLPSLSKLSFYPCTILDHDYDYSPSSHSIKSDITIEKIENSDPPLSLIQSPLLSFLLFLILSSKLSHSISTIVYWKIESNWIVSTRKGGTKGAHEITSGRYLIEKARPYAYLVRRRRPTGFLRYAAAVATRRAASRRVVARAYLPVPVCPPIFQSTRVCVCVVRSGARYEIPPVPLRRPSSRPAAPSCFRFKSIVLFCAFLILISFFKTIYIFHIIYFLYDVYSICVLLLHYVIYLLY